MAKKNNEFKCEFCDKTFVKESSLVAHQCAKKMRYLDKNNKNSVIGFMTFQRFYQLTTISKKPVTFEKFISSSLYGDFLKYARWLNDSSIVGPQAYTDYLIKGKFKLRDWTKSSVYEGYLRSYLFNENPLDALDRTVTWINNWCEENNIAPEHFFESVSTNKIVDVLRNGKVSPWLFFVCENSIKLLDRFDQSQYQLLGNLLDSKVWMLKIKKHKKEVQDCKVIIEGLGL